MATTALVQSMERLASEQHKSSLPLFLWIFSFSPKRSSDGSAASHLLRSPTTWFTVAFGLAMLAAGAIPAVDYIYGVWTQSITESDASAEDIRDASHKAGYIIFATGVAQLLMTWASLYAFMTSSETLTCTLRNAYTASVIAQDIDWFHSHGVGQVCAAASSDIDSIRIALGEKMLHIANGIGVLLGSTILGFLRAPSIAGVLFPLIPITMTIFAILGKLNEKVSRPASDIEGRIADFVEQVLTSLPTVHSFGIGETLISKLRATLFGPLARRTKQRAIIRAFELSSVYAVMMWNYSVFFAWGAHQIAGGHTRVGATTTAFWSFINAFFTIANIVPHLGALVRGYSSMRTLRMMIEHEPSLDFRNQKGQIVDEALFRGIDSYCFRLQDVSFAYHTRPEVLALKNITLNIEHNKFVALVGPSGSGKSTLLSLLLREHEILLKQKSCDQDPEKNSRPDQGGIILFGESNIQDYNITSYRSQVAVVSQQLHLFSGSVLDNVAASLSVQQEASLDQNLIDDETSPPSRHPDEDIRAEVIAALRKAQAWDFVSRLPQGVDTCIAGGSQNVLSGGQKQRLALARALIRRPKVLFLDEATSALDSRTEEMIRLVIEREQRERPMTCIVVAHRLSTVRHADKIVVLVNGRITDEGTHDDLMNAGRKDATYRGMVLRQMSCSGEDSSMQQATHARQSQSQDAETWSLSAKSLESQNLILRKHAAGIDEMARIDEVPHTVPPSHGKAHVVANPSHHRHAVSARKSFSTFFTRTSGLRLQFAVGCAAALTASAVFPASGYLTGNGVAALAAHDAATVRDRGYFWSLLLFIMGIANAVLYTTQGYFLESASFCVSHVFQLDSVRRLAGQSLSSFASFAEDGGTLAAAVAQHACQVATGSGTVLGNILLSTGNFLGSIALAFALSWEATVVTFAPICLVLGANYLTVVQLQKAETAFSSRTDRCTKYLSEIVVGIRTIATLGKQKMNLQRFMEKAELESASFRSPLLWGSLGFAIGQSFMVLPSALVFYWVGVLYADKKIALQSVYAVFELQLITGFAAARLTTFVPDIGRARISLRTISGWLKRPVSRTDAQAYTPDNETFRLGDIQFDDVTFKYPQRPDVQVLQQVNLSIPKGSTLAFVGTSGSGKSSALALLSRFYDPTHGRVLIDGCDLRDLNLGAVRERTALVSQDATLFQGTIRWNIAIGAPPHAQITESDIRAACRQADAMDFIDNLPEGLDTDIGLKGDRLSGGQRQRLCIARALIRDPELLLLDEASSALDAASEAVVQKALTESSPRRTTIIVAHRLASIKNVDCIFVFEDGKVVETGSHKELVNRDSRYRELVRAQI